MFWEHNQNLASSQAKLLSTNTPGRHSTAGSLSMRLSTWQLLTECLPTAYSCWPSPIHGRDTGMSPGSQEKKKRVIDIAASCRQKWQMQCSGGFSVTIFIYIASPTSRIGRTLSHVHSQAPMGEAALYSWMKVLCLTTRSILMCF